MSAARTGLPHPALTPSPAQWSFLLACVLVTLAAGYSTYRYAAAARVVEARDLKSLGSSNDRPTFYTAPFRIFLGQDMSRAELVEYLRSIGYTESSGSGGPGTYTLRGKSAIYIARRSPLPLFGDLTVTFGRNVVRSVATTSGPVGEAVVEGAPIATFVNSLRSSVAEKVNVSRINLEPNQVVGTTFADCAVKREDAQFFSHRGINWRGVARAFFHREGGGSSISQQAAKNYFELDPSHSYIRKIDEFYLTAALENRAGKDVILTVWMNHIPFGRVRGGVEVYGAAAAAREYFGKDSIADLSLAECATLAGMIHRPQYYVDEALKGNYDPLKNRRDATLDLFNRIDPQKYTPEMIRAAKAEPLELRFSSLHVEEKPVDLLAKAFVKYAGDRFSLDGVKSPAVESDNKIVLTTLEPTLVRDVQSALDSRLQGVEKRFPLIQRAADAEPAEGDGWRAKEEPDRWQGAVVVLDPRSGDVLAMVGGRSDVPERRGMNRAVEAWREPGSVIKVFLTEAALEFGRTQGGSPFTLGTVIGPDDPAVDAFRPKVDVGAPGLPRFKFAPSDNDYGTALLGMVGLARFKDFMSKVADMKPPAAGGSMANGFGPGVALTPIQLARALTPLATGGLITPPRSVRSFFVNNAEIPLEQPSPVRAVSPETAFLTSDMMRTVVGRGRGGERGTMREAMRLSGLPPEMPVGGKTASLGRDAWAVSVSPACIVVVWIGPDLNSDVRGGDRLFSSGTAALIWSDVLRAVKKHRPDLLEGEWRRPPTVKTVKVDPRRGCATAVGIDELFVAGREPRPCA